MGVGATTFVWAVVLCLISRCLAGVPELQSDRQAGSLLQIHLQPVAAAADDVKWKEIHRKAFGVHMTDVQSSQPTLVAQATSAPHSAWSSLGTLLQSAHTPPNYGAKSHQDSSPSTQPWHGPAAAAPMLSRKLLAQQHAAQHMHMQQQRDSWPYSSAYGVLGPVAGLPVLAVALMLMMTGPLAWLKCSKQSSTSAHTPAGSLTDTSCMVDTNCLADRSARDQSVDAAVNLGADTDTAAAGGVAGGKAAGSKGQEAQPRLLLAACHGWTLSDDCTTPQVGSIGGQAVRFGPELAPGAAGRVFRATWAGSEVAVRVLHTASTAADRSQQQLQQLVSLRHPNVLRTFCCVTFTPQGGPREVCEAAGAAATNTSILADSTQQLNLQDDAPKARSVDSSSGARRDQGPQQRQQLNSATDDGGAETWLVQEYCDLGSLSQVALKWQGAGDSDQHMLERLSLLSDVARGLREVHGLGLAHEDLNASSVLVCSARSPNSMVAKLADLGPCAAAKQRLRSSISNVSSIRTLSHVAPEVLRKSGAGPEADIYAFGILMWEVYTGQQAYRKLRDAAHLYEAIVIQNLRPKIPEGMPADYQLLMERCWSSDPADRPPADKLLGCLSVMAAERSRRLNPDAPSSPSATPAAAAAVAAAAAAAAASPRAAGSLRSPGGGQFSFQQQGSGSYSADPMPWRNSIGGLGVAGRAPSITRPSFPGLPTAPNSSGPLPGVPGSIQHQKSCPALAFEAFLRSNSRLPKDPEDDKDSDCGSDNDGDVAGVGLDVAAFADDPVFAELWAEEEELQQMRASSQTQSGPGSAPVLHHSQPHKRYADGLDGMDDLGRLEESHMWHI